MLLTCRWLLAAFFGNLHSVAKMAQQVLIGGQEVLSVEQKRFYDENGYIVVKNVVPQDELAKYRQRFKDICEGLVKPLGLAYMKDVALLKTANDGERTMTKIQDFFNDDVLFSYCKLPSVLAIVQDLIGGPNTLAIHTMFINKPPDPGTQTSRHPLHQDLHYFPMRPAENICCAWTAVERCVRANGCLVVVPGSHKSRLHPHTYPDWPGGVNMAYYGIQDFDPKQQPRLHMEMDPGDTIFFHSLLIHGSGTNRTNGFRKAISCHYANTSLCHYIDVAGTSQEMIAKEAQEILRMRFGDEVHLDYQDFWKIRALPVSGTQAHL